MYKTLTAFSYLLINKTFLLIFCEIVFTYIKISQDLSHKYYQNSKERLQKVDKK